MPVQLLPLGTTVPMVQNQIYALPAVEAIMFTDATTPTIQLSNTAAFTANVAVTMTAGQANLGGGFIRATTAGVNITLKRD